MKVKALTKPSQDLSVPCNWGHNQSRIGIETLPKGIVEANLQLMAKYKLLLLVIKLNPKSGPRSSTMYNLPDNLTIDMRNTKYCVTATQEGNTWPSKRARAIQAFMGVTV